MTASGGCSILLFHRRRPGLGRALFQDRWRRRMAALSGRQRSLLGYSRYTQIQAAPALDPVAAAIAATRSRIFLGLVSALGGGSLASRGPAAPGTYDLVERFWYATREEAERCLLEGALKAAAELRRAVAREAAASKALLGVQIDVVPPTLSLPCERIMFCLRARPGSDRAAMQRYWSEEHTPLAHRQQRAMTYGGYEQVHASGDVLAERVAAALTDAAPSDIDGTASLLYANRPALIGSLLRPSLHAANLRLIQDELSFIDPLASEIVVGREVAISEGQAPERLAPTMAGGAS